MTAKRAVAQADGSFVSHLECSATGERFPHDRLYGLSPAGAPLLIRYYLERVAAAVTKQDLLARKSDMWRLRELLPLSSRSDPVQLGEAATPLVSLSRSARALGLGGLVVKDEGRLPTGSFKARGMAMAVTMARHFSVTRIAVPTAGNAGSAAAAYGARAGMEVHVFMPADTPEANVAQIELHGARGHRVDGLIDLCGRLLREGTAEQGWHDLSTLAEPYRIEGKKTMGLELAEQMGWKLPDAIYYPTGGGTGFIGMWKAFAELQAMGWIGAKLPRMVAVQSDGCRPIVDASERGLDHVPEPWAPVTTEIPGTRVPKPLGDRLILEVIEQSKGFATSASDDEALEAQSELGRREGFAACLEGAL
ncbi:MAG: threonine synthase, partial [Kiloniellales bacterium]|nr:threonine synthase [Kiloniellales bacterium]